MDIFNDNYNILLNLNNLSEFVFENCEFENDDLITSLKLESLSLINYKIKSYALVNVFKNIEELTIINRSIVIEKLNMLNHLKYLQISYSNIIDNIKFKKNNPNELVVLKKLEKFERISLWRV